MRFLFCCLCLILLTGCARYKVSTQTFLTEQSQEKESLYKNKMEALSHPLYNYIPRHRSQIRWYDLGHWTTWMLLGNDDDGIFGEEASYRIDEPVTGWKAFTWLIRNPLHNFTFYTIGSAGCVNSEFTLLKINCRQLKLCRYKSQGTTTFAGKGTSFFLGFHGWKPFVSLRVAYSKISNLDFYFGWRERGNFGIKLVRTTHKAD